MEQNDQQPDAILNGSKLTLTLPPDRDGSRARLCAGVYNGNVSLTCFTGLKTDDGKSKIVGDVLFDEAVEIAGQITPVPGGVGTVTTAMLLKNIIDATKLQAG